MSQQSPLNRVGDEVRSYPYFGTGRQEGASLLGRVQKISTSNIFERTNNDKQKKAGFSIASPMGRIYQQPRSISPASRHVDAKGFMVYSGRMDKSANSRSPIKIESEHDEPDYNTNSFHHSIKCSKLSPGRSARTQFNTLIDVSIIRSLHKPEPALPTSTRSSREIEALDRCANLQDQFKDINQQLSKAITHCSQETIEKQKLITVIKKKDSLLQTYELRQNAVQAETRNLRQKLENTIKQNEMLGLQNKALNTSVVQWKKKNGEIEHELVVTRHKLDSAQDTIKKMSSLEKNYDNSYKQYIEAIKEFKRRESSLILEIQEMKAQLELGKVFAENLKKQTLNHVEQLLQEFSKNSSKKYNMLFNKVISVENRIDSIEKAQKRLAYERGLKIEENVRKSLFNFAKMQHIVGDLDMSDVEQEQQAIKQQEARETQALKKISVGKLLVAKQLAKIVTRDAFTNTVVLPALRNSVPLEEFQKYLAQKQNQANQIHEKYNAKISCLELDYQQIQAKLQKERREHQEEKRIEAQRFIRFMNEIKLKLIACNLAYCPQLVYLLQVLLKEKQQYANQLKHFTESQSKSSKVYILQKQLNQALKDRKSVQKHNQKLRQLLITRFHFPQSQLGEQGSQQNPTPLKDGQSHQQPTRPQVNNAIAWLLLVQQNYKDTIESIGFFLAKINY